MPTAGLFGLADHLERLSATVDQLQARGDRPAGGQIVDATLVSAPTVCPHFSLGGFEGGLCLSRVL